MRVRYCPDGGVLRRTPKSPPQRREEEAKEERGAKEEEGTEESVVENKDPSAEDAAPESIPVGEDSIADAGKDEAKVQAEEREILPPAKGTEVSAHLAEEEGSSAKEEDPSVADTEDKEVACLEYVKTSSLALRLSDTCAYFRSSSLNHTSICLG